MTDSNISMAEIQYDSVGRCLQVSNGIIDFVVTLDCGPRVIRVGFADAHNEFCEFPAEQPGVESWGGAMWHPRGGHRLWHSPEHMPRTYIADNTPLTVTVLADGIRVRQEVEPWVQLQKEMEVRITGKQQITVQQRLFNKNAWTIEAAVWGLSVMAPGGLEIVPQPKRETGLLHNRVLGLWPYSRMTDPRVYWGERYITLQQDEHAAGPFKFGIDNQLGWAAYLNRGHLFVKRYEHQLDAVYPDGGMSYETYTNAAMLEMETLSPLTRLAPDDSVEHTEIWELHREVQLIERSEAAIDSLIRRYVAT